MENNPEGLIVALILGFALLVVIMMYVSGGSDLIGEVKFLPEKLIATKGENIQIPGEPRKIEPGVWEYPSVSIDVTLKYTGELKKNFEVVPVITFKGTSKKANAVAPNGAESGFFILSEKEQDVRLVVHNIEGEPKIKVIGEYGTETYATIEYKETVLAKMNSVKITDKEKNFTIKLVDIGVSISPESLCRCRATFRIACKAQAHYPELYQMGCCDQTGELNDCQATIRPEQICNSTVILRAETLDCSQKTAQIYFYAEKGYYDQLFEVGEEVGVSFFEKSSCTDNYEDVEQIIKCSGGSGSMGGTYKFVKPL